MVVAFVITPWLAMVALRKLVENRDGRGGVRHHASGRSTASARAVLGPILDRRWLAWATLGVVVLLLVGGMALPAFRRGAAEDAALRQQERVPDRRRHARGHHAGTRPTRSPASWASYLAGVAEVRDYRALRGAGLADGLQRDGPPLLPPPGAERGRHPRQPGPEGGPRAAVARDPAAHPRRPDRAGREPTGRTSSWSRCRPARRCSPRSRPRSTARPTPTTAS